MNNDTIQENLTGKQVRFLRGLGHHLTPKVTIGREGITATLVAAARAVLTRHELIKVKVGNNCELERKEAAELLAEKSGAALVQVLGRTFLLYRANPDREKDERIVLP
ncbi:MAG: ribosome assembly RNA-binding protein YhbY [Desulfobacterales bacterium]|nr:ribosome assembly RNA-binding protein YhbY [Desulfobacterales bacterium]